MCKEKTKKKIKKSIKIKEISRRKGHSSMKKNIIPLSFKPYISFVCYSFWIIKKTMGVKFKALQMVFEVQKLYQIYIFLNFFMFEP
jgi:hypothetical protein